VQAPKQYILAATAVTLAVSAVAVVTTVVLSPARIAFSVTGGGALVALNLTLEAANPSRRAGVEYSSVTARLQLYSPSHAGGHNYIIPSIGHHPPRGFIDVQGSENRISKNYRIKLASTKKPGKVALKVK
jgi:hypothetical protein